MITLNKTQKRYLAIIQEQNDELMTNAFLKLCEKNGCHWRSVLFEQFGRDADVSGVGESLLAGIRRIRNTVAPRLN